MCISGQRCAGKRLASSHLERTDRARGSTLVSEMSANRILVGSNLAPAPPTHSTGMPRCLHAASRSTCNGARASVTDI
eukprot:scaffold147742_cov27-Prasinocladus_malaysianus.AAC.1